MIPFVELLGPATSRFQT